MPKKIADCCSFAETQTKVIAEHAGECNNNMVNIYQLIGGGGGSTGQPVADKLTLSVDNCVVGCWDIMWKQQAGGVAQSQESMSTE